MSDSERQVKIVGKTGSYAGSELVITRGELTVGRNKDNDLVMDEKTISANHAKIVLNGDKYEVHDLNSTNGTYVNGKQVTHSEVRSDDVIRFDIYEFTFFDEGQVARTVVSAAPNFEDKGTIARAPAIEAEPAPQPPVAEKAAAAPAAAAAQKTSSAPKTTKVDFQPGGNMFIGLIIGLIFAGVIAIGGFILSMMTTGVSFDFIELVKLQIQGFAGMHTHVQWIGDSMTWNLQTILVLVSLILAPFVGGLFTQIIGKSNRFATAFVFSLFYVVIFLVLAMVIMGFDFNRMQVYGFLGIDNGWLGMVALYGYFFGVTFVLSFIGSLFGGKR